MGELIRKYVSRAPRYVLRPQDRSVMRFSLERTLGEGGIEKTVLLNLSETGMAFLVERGREPHLGDRVKVEIPIPGGDQIAWWAAVVRVEEFESTGWLYSRDPFETDNQILIGLRFDKLPEPHSRAIRQGIHASFMQAMREQRMRTTAYYKAFFVDKVGKVIVYAILSLIAFGIVYWLAQPDAHYDAKRGAPWGERFKF